jgi:hypothetical protein
MKNKNPCPSKLQGIFKVPIGTTKNIAASIKALNPIVTNKKAQVDTEGQGAVMIKLLIWIAIFMLLFAGTYAFLRKMQIIG